MTSQNLIPISSHPSDHAMVEPSTDYTPVEYILGETTFCGLNFTVTRDVMIPRVSSETLVHTAVSLLNNMIHENPNKDTVRILDMGTGSGNLLLSCLSLLRSSLLATIENTSLENTSLGTDRVVGSQLVRLLGVGMDVSPEALLVAENNARRLELLEHTSFMRLGFSDLHLFQEWNDQLSSSPTQTTSSAQLNPEANGIVKEKSDISPYIPFDLIICNPPYSSEGELTRLSIGRRLHEPSIALFAPGHNMSYFEVIASSIQKTYLLYKKKKVDNLRIHESKDTEKGIPKLDQNNKKCENEIETLFLKEGGYLVIEVGSRQEGKVQHIFHALCPCLIFVRSEKDLNGIIRCLIFKMCFY